MTVLYVFSGTGNSLWVAKQLAARLGDCQIRRVSPQTSAVEASEEGMPGVVGFVFPVYMWGPPGPVREFAKTFVAGSAAFLFAVAVNAGQVADSLKKLDTDLKSRNSQGLQAGFSLRMPSSYIPWGGAEPLERQQALDSAALEKLEVIAAAVRQQSRLALERGPLWQRVLLSGLANGMAAPQVPGMARSFSSTAACTSCGHCVRVCPTANVSLSGGRPQWGRRCSQCFACLQWCPVQAIEYGKATIGKVRYHHREIGSAEFATFNTAGQA